MLDKENIRQWLIKEHGFSGHGTPPAADRRGAGMLARKYIEVFELLTGETFESEVGDVEARIERNLRARGYLVGAPPARRPVPRARPHGVGQEDLQPPVLVAAAVVEHAHDRHVAARAESWRKMAVVIVPGMQPNGAQLTTMRRALARERDGAADGSMIASPPSWRQVGRRLVEDVVDVGLAAVAPGRAPAAW